MPNHKPHPGHSLDCRMGVGATLEQWCTLWAILLSADNHNLGPAAEAFRQSFLVGLDHTLTTAGAWQMMEGEGKRRLN